DTPPPSQPATLLVMMLLVTLTVFQRQPFRLALLHRPLLFELPLPFGKLSTSVPLMCCNRRPPPLPLSAALPMIRLALITRPGPVPSLGVIVPGGERQSLSLVAAHGGSWSGAPMTSRPPPLVVIVGLVLWLNRIALCSISPFLVNPRWTTPPPSPVLMLPHTQLLLNR